MKRPTVDTSCIFYTIHHLIKTGEFLRSPLPPLVSLLTCDFAKMGERRAAGSSHVLVRLGNRMWMIQVTATNRRTPQIRRSTSINDPVDVWNDKTSESHWLEEGRSLWLMQLACVFLWLYSIVVSSILILPFFFLHFLYLFAYKPAWGRFQSKQNWNTFKPSENVMEERRKA